MKCKICGSKTNWDVSYGYEEFIVCPHCFDKIHKSYSLDETMTIIFMLGKIVREKNEKVVDK